jgi:hypothetical protein
MLVIPMAQLIAQLDDTLTGLGSLELGLFLAPITVDLTTAIGDVLAGQLPWMAQAPLTGRTGAAAAGPYAFSQWDPLTFVNSSGGSTDIYGYYVSDSGNTFLAWAENNASAPVSVADGSSYVVRAYYSRTNQT